MIINKCLAIPFRGVFMNVVIDAMPLREEGSPVRDDRILSGKYGFCPVLPDSQEGNRYQAVKLVFSGEMIGSLFLIIDEKFGPCEK
jgi:hypothetical protein